MLFRTTVQVLVFAASLSSSALASTYIVDSDGAGQFLDIQSAINAAAPGDVLLVQLGSSSGSGLYSGFTVDKTLVIIGYGGIRAVGSTQVQNLAAGQRVAIVDMDVEHLDISNCVGPVIVQGGNFQQNYATVSASNDVRFAQFIANGDAIHGAFDLQGSRVEIVDCDLRGGQGTINSHTSGTPGLSAGTGARIQIARSNVVGGFGSDATTSSFTCGNGAPALALAGPLEIYAVGPQVVEPIIGTVGNIVGGGGGYGYFEGGFECYADGQGSCAVTGSGSVHRDAGVLVQGGFTDQQFHCMGGGYEQSFCGPTELTITPPDPSLRLTGTPAPGASITFGVYGEPGASATIYLGRGLVVTPTAGVDIEQLAPHNRTIHLGAIPGSGLATRTVSLPATYPQGLVLVAQAEVTGSNGLRRTNSTPIVLR